MLLSDREDVSGKGRSAISGLGSIDQYEYAYKDFMEWYDSKKLKNVSENVKT